MSIHCKYSSPFDKIMTESLVDLQTLSSNSPSFSASSSSDMPIQSAWKTVEKAAAAIVNQDAGFMLSESDFPSLLDSKPEVDDFKAVKGRRNAGEKLLQKKMSGRDFVVKQLVGCQGQGQRSKAIGKKRRARLLSDENSAEMRLNVPYSMNRKNRWEMNSAAECLRDRRSDENVQLSAVDQHFTVNGLSPNRDIMAFHQVDDEGTLSSRQCRSLRGSTLSELNASSMVAGSPSAAEDEKPLGIRYVMAKAHPMAKHALAGSLDKAKPQARSTRRAQLDVSVYSSTEEGELQHDEGLLSASAKVDESTVSMYLPRQKTYTLADFVREKRTLNRSHRNSRNVPLESFVQIEIPDVDEIEQVAPTQRNPLANLPPRNCSLFKIIYLTSSTLGIQSRDDWLKQCNRMLVERPELRFRWLNGAQCSIQVDLTPILTASAALHSPHLVVTLAYESSRRQVRLLLNGSQECTIDVGLVERADSVDGLEALFALIAKNAKISESNTPPLNAEHGGELNSIHLSTPIHPLDNYALLSNSKIDLRALPAKKEDLRGELEPEEEDDFEKIEMEEFADSDQLLEKWQDSALDEQVAQMKTFCGECGENDVTKILLLDACGHSFCSRCLKAFLHQQLCEGAPKLECAFNKCSVEIPPSMLQSIFELPLVMWTLRSCADAGAKQQDRRLVSCPNGCGLASVDQKTENSYGQAHCLQCKAHFCTQSNSHPPHWPLSCKQFHAWTRKRDLQTQKSSSCSSDAAAEGGKSENQISASYWAMYSEARKRRMDLTLANKISKEARKHIDYKRERQFWELRKACLQLIENATAYLYLTRAERPENWSTIKSLIGNLQSELNLVENLLLYNTPQNADKSEEIQRLQRMLRKAIAEINSGGGQSSTSKAH